MADRNDRRDKKYPIFSEGQWAELAKSLSLSRRQMDVIKCVFRGLGTRRIAHHLGIGVPTVRGYMVRVFRKLEAADRTEIVLRVLSRMQDESRSHGPLRVRKHSS